MALFTSSCDNLADFAEGSPYTAPGETVSIATAPTFMGTGSVLKVSVTTSALEVGVRVGNIGGLGRNFDFDFGLPSAGSLNGFNIISHAWYGDANAYDGDLLQVGIQQSSRISGKYNFTMQTPFDAYASLSLATKPLNRDQRYAIRYRISDDQIALYIAEYVSGVRQPYEYQTYARVPNKGRNFRSITLGKFTVYGGGNGYSGDLYFDNVTLDTAAPATVAADNISRIQAAYAGWKSISMRPADGAVVRHMGNESGGSKGDGQFGFSYPGSDVVSEGQAYGLRLAVNVGDQTGFDLMESFAYNKLCRRNPQAATAVNNSAATPVAQNLMGWKWEDDKNGFYDANWASDAEVDRIIALYWAHKRWGSAGTVNYLARANAAAADMKTYSFRQDTVTFNGTAGTAVQIQTADLYGGTSGGSPGTFEINPSYGDPTMYELAKEANPTDATFWSQAITGYYHILVGAAAFNSYGGPTEWATYDMSQHKAVIRPERSADRGDGYGYNAFRVIPRAYMHYLLYGNTLASAYLTGAFRTFSTNEWNTASPQRFAMEKTNTGTGLYSGYEKSMNTYVQWLTQRMTPATTVSNAIFNGKLAMDLLFRNSSNGAFFADNPGDNDPSTPGDTGNFSYFNGSWMLMFYIMEYGDHSVSYGFNVGTATVVNPPPTGSNSLALLGVG